MVYCVYVKKTDKSDWRLVDATSQLEQLSISMKDALLKATDPVKGNKGAIVGVKKYETSFYIPEFIKKLESDEIFYN
jgi:hypothetical protein